MNSPLKIGEVARRAGVRVDTVRFYEREGLLPTATRTVAGYRMFGPATVERVIFIKEIQALGVTLAELADFLKALDRGDANRTNSCARLEAVIARVDARMVEMRRMRRKLGMALEALESGKKGPMIERAYKLAGCG